MKIYLYSAEAVGTRLFSKTLLANPSFFDGDCYFAIAGNNGVDRRVIWITEGYATAASIREATGCVVAVAFDAENLELETVTE